MVQQGEKEELEVSPERVQQLVGNIKASLEELLHLERISFEEMRQHEGNINRVMHEIEILKLNAAARVKVMGYVTEERIARRVAKNAYFMSSDFNKAFESRKVLSSMSSGLKAIGRIRKAQVNLIKDNGLVASILAKPKKELVEEPEEEFVAEIEVVDSLAEVAASEEEIRVPQTT